LQSNSKNITNIRDTLKKLYILQNVAVEGDPSLARHFGNGIRPWLRGIAADGSVAALFIDVQSGLLIFLWSGTDSLDDVLIDIKIGRTSKYGTLNVPVHYGFGHHMSQYRWNFWNERDDNKSVTFTLDRTHASYPLTSDGVTWYFPGFIAILCTYLEGNDIGIDRVILSGHSLGAAECWLTTNAYYDAYTRFDIAQAVSDMLGTGEIYFPEVDTITFGCPPVSDVPVNTGYRHLNVVTAANVVPESKVFNIFSDPITSQRISGGYIPAVDYNPNVPMSTVGVSAIALEGVGVGIAGLGLVVNTAASAATAVAREIASLVGVKAPKPISRAVNIGLTLSNPSTYLGVLLHKWDNYKRIIDYTDFIKRLDNMANAKSHGEVYIYTIGPLDNKKPHFGECEYILGDVFSLCKKCGKCIRKINRSASTVSFKSYLEEYIYDKEHKKI